MILTIAIAYSVLIALMLLGGYQKAKANRLRFEREVKAQFDAFRLAAIKHRIRVSAEIERKLGGQPPTGEGSCGGPGRRS